MTPEPTMEDLIRKRITATREREAKELEDQWRLDTDPLTYQAAVDRLSTEVARTLTWFRNTLEEERYCIGALACKPFVNELFGEITELTLNSTEHACLMRKMRDKSGVDEYDVWLFSDGSIYLRRRLAKEVDPREWIRIDLERKGYEIGHIEFVTLAIEAMRDRAVNIPYPDPTL